MSPETFDQFERRGEVPVEMKALLATIGDEVKRAEKLHKPINSLHEGYAVILEEMEEFWDQVKLRSEKRDSVAVRTELIQTAAMCVRTILNVCDRAKRRTAC